MPFTVEEFRDLVRLLEERPEWREELRRLVLTSELLALPEQIAELRARSEQQFQELIAAQQRTEARVDALAAAQQRTEARVDALAAAQQRTEARVDTLADQIAALAAAQQRTEEEVRGLAQALRRMEGQVTLLTQAMQTLTNDVGELKGKSLEADYRTKGPAYFSRVVRRPHVLTADELATLVEDARDNRVLLEFEAQEIYEADVIVRGRRLEDGTAVYLLVEVSWGVGRHDVERATQRAALLARLGTPVIPVVAGKRITTAAARLAQRQQVWQLTNGRAVAPGDATLSS
jgi:hypothetical protein